MDNDFPLTKAFLDSMEGLENYHAQDAWKYAKGRAPASLGLPPPNSQAVFNPAGGGRMSPAINANRFYHDAMVAMIASRMGWDGETIKAVFRELRCARLNDEKAVVWIIHDDTALTIEDDLNLFPSDALVTSLRLLLS
jgi:hypothetical protein